MRWGKKAFQPVPGWPGHVGYDMDPKASTCDCFLHAGGADPEGSFLVSDMRGLGWASSSWEGEAGGCPLSVLRGGQSVGRLLKFGEPAMEMRRRLPASAFSAIQRLQVAAGGDEAQVITSALNMAVDGGDHALNALSYRRERDEMAATINRIVADQESKVAALVARHAALERLSARAFGVYGAMMRKLRHRPAELEAFRRRLGLMGEEMNDIQAALVRMVRGHLDATTPVRLTVGASVSQGAT